MTGYKDLSKEEMEALYEELAEEYGRYASLGLELNMARGKPSPEQLDLSMPMLDMVSSTSDFCAQDGTDCRNYGVLAGLPEARAFIADMMGVDPGQVVVCGASSLTIMFDTVARGWISGFGGDAPWSELEQVKFICPVPGYDRHFAICEHFGIEMIPIALTGDGPDVQEVQRLVEDPAVKGIWCVPQYANPTGITYSDETVKGLANLEPASSDFRIFWDNAYAVHHLYPEEERQDHVLDIIDECARAGNPDMVFEFCSTSKVTFPGAGISAFISSKENVDEMLAALAAQAIGFDKLNQLRHVRFLKDAQGVAEHMQKQAQHLRPRFEKVYEVFEDDLGGCNIATWTKPNGGYFISFEGLEGTAKRTVELAKEAGVQLTAVGATWPLGIDPRDSNIRIAPSYPGMEELENAARVFTVCARMAALEKLMEG